MYKKIVLLCSAIICIIVLLAYKQSPNNNENILVEIRDINVTEISEVTNFDIIFKENKWSDKLLDEIKSDIHLYSLATINYTMVMINKETHIANEVTA